MKTVYTLTFHLANNYGALLQTYALQKILQKKYDTKVLNYDNYVISDSYRIIKKGTRNVIKIGGRVIKKIPHFIAEIKRIHNFNKFRKKIIFTNRFDNIKNFDLTNSSCIITGSDQVWNYKLTKKIDQVYFLDFPYNGKKISYAASCGNNENLDKLALSKISKLDKISVREESLKDYLISNGINNVETVLDPTLLLTKEEWTVLLQTDRLEDEPYIFAYSVGNETKEYIKFVNEVSKHANLKIVYFDKREKRFNKEKQSFYGAGPEEFLNLLYNAEYIITTSFHGFALSSILNKKMFVFLSTAQDRLISLSKKLSLEDRIISEKNYEINELISKKINWDLVNKKLKIERRKSIDWLYNNIDEVITDEKK